MTAWLMVLCLGGVGLGIHGALAATLSPEEQQQAVRRLLATVDYIGGDYPGAVQNGQIISAPEYAEMQHFSETVTRQYGLLADAWKTKHTAAALESNIKALQSLIELKADAHAIRAITKSIRRDVMTLSSLTLIPIHPADFQLARKSYGTNCMTCHGEQGRGDGPAAKTLDPKPRNFHETSVMEASSPSKFFNILPLGVERTAMTSFADLPEDERWSLAFYLSAMRYLPQEAFAQKTWDPQSTRTQLTPTDQKILRAEKISLEFLAHTADEDLRLWAKNTLHAENPEAVLRVLRTALPFDPNSITTGAVAQAQGAAKPPLSPSDSKDALHYLDKAKTSVERASVLFAQGNRQAARDALLDAYLDGFEHVEPVLRLKNANEVKAIESVFLSAQASTEKADAEEFQTEIAALLTLFANAREHLQASNFAAASNAVGVVLSSLVIILREGFEAFLIIAAVLAILKNIGADKAKIWIHAGWISAVFAGIGTYFIFSKVIQVSGAGREMVEAVCSASASLVLFYVSFWLLSQSEKRTWERYIKSKTLTVLSTGKIGALFGLAFIAVYREAAETALFYHALHANADNSTFSIGLGLFLGTAMLTAMCWAITKLGVRIPLRKFFLWTSMAMIGIAVVLMGKAVFQAIQAGVIGATMIKFVPRIDLLGIYPVVEPLAAQALLALIAVGMVLWVRRRRHVAESLPS